MSGQAPARAEARADRIAARLAARGWGAGPSVVLIDGGAGSGKTTLARHLAYRLGAEIVHLDALYPGWGGLSAGAVAVERDVLARGGYRRFDWERGEQAEWVSVARSGPLVIEGCGAITAGTVAAARRLCRGEARGEADRGVTAIWVECPEPERRARALARDGELFRPHWDRWAAQEAVHRATDLPIARSREVVHTGGQR